jgi:hypothetical protein
MTMMNQGNLVQNLTTPTTAELSIGSSFHASDVSGP